MHLTAEHTVQQSNSQSVVLSKTARAVQIKDFDCMFTIISRHVGSLTYILLLSQCTGQMQAVLVQGLAV